MEPIGSAAVTVTADAHRVGVSIDVSDLASRLEREALRLINDLSQQGLSGDALADAVAEGLRNLSDAPMDRAARGAVGEAVNLGRNLEAQRRAEEIQEVVRTEILDRNTCGPCRALDGKVLTMNTPEYFELMPPNKCDGWEQCRGLLIYLSAA